MTQVLARGPSLHSLDPIQTYMVNQVVPYQRRLEDTIGELKGASVSAKQEELVGLVRLMYDDLVKRVAVAGTWLSTNLDRDKIDDPDVKYEVNRIRCILEKSVHLCGDIFDATQKSQLTLSPRSKALLERDLQIIMHPSTHSGSGIYRVGVGIANAGRNCAFNSLMQVLCNVPALRDHLLMALSDDYMEFKDFASQYIRDRLFAARSNTRVVTSANSQNVRLCMYRQHPELISSSHLKDEDSGELLTLIGSQIHPLRPLDDSGDPLNHSNAAIANPLFNWIKTTRKYHVAGTELESIVGTTECELDAAGCSAKYDPEFQLRVPLQDKHLINFESLMESFFRARPQGAETARYNDVNINVEEIRTDFETQPSHLIVSLGRFSHQQTFSGEFVRAKIDHVIDVPERYVLPREFIETHTHDVNPEYRLKCFINHVGETISTGHYIAYIRQDDGRWFCFNDRTVTLCDAITVKKALSKSYILYFEDSKRTCSDAQALRIRKEREDETEDFTKDLAIEASIEVEKRRIAALQKEQELYVEKHLKPIEQDIERLDLFYKLLISDEASYEDQLKAFEALPQEFKNLCYKAKWIHDGSPVVSGYGKQKVLEDLKCLLKLNASYLTDQRDNLVEQYLFMKEQERALQELDFIRFKEADEDLQVQRRKEYTLRSHEMEFDQLVAFQRFIQGEVAPDACILAFEQLKDSVKEDYSLYLWQQKECPTLERKDLKAFALEQMKESGGRIFFEEGIEVIDGLGARSVLDQMIDHYGVRQRKLSE